MRTIVTLDPEFVPWFPGVPNIRLRRKHNKLLAFIMPILALAIVAAGMLVYLNRGAIFGGKGNDGDSVPSDMAGSVATLPAMSGDMPRIGKIGYLTIRNRKGDTLVPCRVYRVTSFNRLIAHGDTLSVSYDYIGRVFTEVYGAFVDVRGITRLVVQCDGKEIHF